MKVAVSTGYPDAAALAAGECDLAFLTNNQMSQASPLFSMLSLPFLYDGGPHMSRALNSEDLLGPLGEQLSGRLVPLAAFYRGGSWVAASKALRTPADFKGVALAMGADGPDKLAAFEALGARVLPYPPGATAALLGVTVDVPPEERPTDDPDAPLTVGAVEVTLEGADGLPGDPADCTLINSFHGISPLWLAAGAEIWGELSDYERAALLEARSGMLYELEQAAEERERARLAELEGRGMHLTEIERPLAAKTVYEDLQPGGYAPPGYFDRRLYDKIQAFS